MVDPSSSEPNEPLPAWLADPVFDAVMRHDDREARAAAVQELVAKYPEHAAAIQMFVNAQERHGADAGDRTGESIGPYRLSALLGRGGFGEVYRAEQVEGLRRDVALKLIKLGMDSRAILQRFARERDALARMNHDAIAKIYDTGTTASGQPWFAMELVDGQPIAAFCDAERLTLRERLQLFVLVCLGVQHAHQKGVVHRDLKPANVLVARDGGQPSPKLIDFGIAHALEVEAGASLLTIDGEVLGTEAYMAPEQLSSKVGEIDTRTDVYALGAILYELLTGVPHRRAQLQHARTPLERREILLSATSVRPSQEPVELGGPTVAWRQKLRSELDWVTAKAMAFEPERRYSSAAGLAADLERYLAYQPVSAGPPTLGYQLKKFVQRYRVQTFAALGVLAAGVAGGVATWSQYREAVAQTLLSQQSEKRAKENERIAAQRADENAELARAEKAAKQRLQDKVREFDLLKGVVLLENVRAAEEALYPAWPEKLAAMNAWLTGDAQKLLSMRADVDAAIASLRSKALPWSEEQQRRDQASHPKFQVYTQRERQRSMLRYADQLAAGAPFEVPALPAKDQDRSAYDLNALAWARVNPTVDGRRVWGEDALGLAYAVAAVDKARAADDKQLYVYLDTLAWAYCINGQDEEAGIASAAALAAAPESKRNDYQDYQRSIAALARKRKENLAAAERAFDEIAAEVSSRQTFHFAEELQAEAFLHDTLTKLSRGLAELADGLYPQVRRRAAWATSLRDEALSEAHAKARPSCAWPKVREAIGNHPSYQGWKVLLLPEDVLDLVPIGENPVTHLWEFYHLPSAWDGVTDPREIPIPQHEPDGSIAMTKATGIVLVLLPGGSFTMGAQKGDPKAPNYDPQAKDDEAPRRVQLAPFLMARHEVTQAQWTRMWTWYQDERDPGHYKAGSAPGGLAMVTHVHPVERVDWAMCNQMLQRYGLELPTEAQWEFGCRAGTTTPWVVEFAQLKDYANVADAAARQIVSSWPFEDWDDGYAVHAPVGSYKANAFGLHDMHGNVWEWCRDWFGNYGSERKGDGLRTGGNTTHRVLRGGGFIGSAQSARSANRGSNTPQFRHDMMGFRASRSLSH